MTQLETYRANAAAEWKAAASTDLPNRRAMHERSAITWEEMAANAEALIELTQVNLAAKAAR
jgi:hypothetical protein